MGSDTHILALGVTIDFLCIWPILYYLLFIHHKERSPISMIPIIFLAVKLAYFVLPTDMEFYINHVAVGLFLLEIPILLQMVINSRSLYRLYQSNKARYPALPAISHIEKAVYEQFSGSILARFIMTELLIYNYLLFGKKNDASGRTPLQFSYHRKGNAGIIAAVLVGSSIVEMTLMHLVIDLVLHKPILAWIITGLSIYSLIWIVGDYKAMRARPIRIIDQQLWLQIGIRWHVSIPLEFITAVELINTKAQLKNFPEKYVSLSNGQRANIMVQLSQEVNGTGLFGKRIRSTNFVFAVDEPDLFRKIIRLQIQSKNQ